MAADLKNFVLRALCPVAADRKVIAEAQLPFEAFIESIAAHVDIGGLICVYELGEPDAAHMFMARLARAGLVKLFVTTNFDRLLEDALLDQKVRFAVHATDRQLASASGAARTVAVLKLHGSIENKPSIRATLRSVASREWSVGRERAIHHALQRRVPVIVMGYSASDAFDITPIIKGAGRSATVLYIDHADGRLPRGTRLSELPRTNPFRDFAGVRIHGDTDQLVREVWRRLRPTLGEERRSTCAANWRQHVERWLADMPVGIRNLIVATLLFQISQSRKSLRYSQAALESLPRPQSVARASCWTLRAQAYHTLGDFEESIRCCRAALRMIKSSDHQARASVHEKLGGAAHSLGRYALARSQYEHALHLAKGDRRRQSLCYSGLGSIGYRLQDFGSAIVNYRKATRLARRIGFKVGEAAYLINLANVAAAQHSYEEARRAYVQASEVATQVAYAAGEITARVALADLDLAVGKYGDAWDSYNAALSRARELRYVVRVVNCLIGLGRVSIARQRSFEALRYLRRARAIARRHAKRAEEAEACEGLGDTHFAAQRPRFAIQYYLDAAAIYRQTRQYRTLVAVLSRVAMCYELLGDGRRRGAVARQMKSLQRRLGAAL